MQCVNVDFPEPLGPARGEAGTPEFNVYFVKSGDSGIAIAVGFRSVYDASSSGEGFCRSHAVKSAVVSGGVK